MSEVHPTHITVRVPRGEPGRQPSQKAFKMRERKRLSHLVCSVHCGNHKEEVNSFMNE